MDMESTSSTWIEGISNDAVTAFVSVVILFFLWWQYSSQSRNTVIHPSQQDQVSATRTILHGESDQPRRRHRDGDNQCPICLDETRFAIETNCGHLFCSPCLLAHWEHGAWIGAMNCPICRQQVSVMLADFSHEDLVADEAVRYLEQIRLYNRRFSGEPRPLMEYITDFPVLARHMFRQLFTVNGLVWMLRVRVLIYFVLVIIYIISPLDIIPEAVAGVFGLLDDVAIALALFVYFTILYRQTLAGVNT